PFISSAQSLPNGNTLITEGSDGRIFEVTRDHQLVWEYISPYWGEGHLNLNMVYRAYRYPHDWVPQLAEPKPTPVQRLDIKQFRVPGAAPLGRDREVKGQGASPEQRDADCGFCARKSRQARVPPLSAPLGPRRSQQRDPPLRSRLAGGYNCRSR